MTNLQTERILHLAELQVKLSSETVHAVRTFMSHLTKAKLPGITKVILFGSRARGNYDVESDVDMAVIFSGPVQNNTRRHKLQMQLSDIRSEAMIETSMAVSAIALWDTELQEPEKQKNPRFFHNVNHEGIDAQAIV